jgi:muconolactone delta-isomerase
LFIWNNHSAIEVAPPPSTELEESQMADLSGFMVVSTFKKDTDMKAVMAVVEEEKTKVKELQAEGRIGSIRLAVPNGKVFLDVFAADSESAASTVRELPMAKWWDLEVYLLSGTA